MELHQIRYFLGVCEALNFTRAAERCNVTQPSLTRAIKLLEEELGGALFRRDRGNIGLTELGRLMRPHLEQVLAETEAAKARARGFRLLEDVTLTVGIMCTIGPAQMIGLMRQFRQRYPRVNILLRDASALALQERLAQGEIDVAIYGLPDPIDERFQARPLYRERFVIAVAPGHPFEARNAVRLGDLDRHNYVCRTECEFDGYVSSLFDARGIAVTEAYATNREDWVQAMILSGLGFGYLPEHSVTLNGLCVRPLIDPSISRAIQVVTVRGRPHTPVVQAFIREATAYPWSSAQPD